MSTKPTSIEESPEEAANKYYNENKFKSDQCMQVIFIGGANHQKKVDKAKVEQLISAKIEFLQSAEGGYEPNKLLCKNDFIISELTDLIKQIKAL